MELTCHQIWNCHASQSPKRAPSFASYWVGVIKPKTSVRNPVHFEMIFSMIFQNNPKLDGVKKNSDLKKAKTKHIEKTGTVFL